jgi:hypothetical protein
LRGDLRDRPLGHPAELTESPSPAYSTPAKPFSFASSRLMISRWISDAPS